MDGSPAYVYDERGLKVRRDSLKVQEEEKVETRDNVKSKSRKIQILRALGSEIYCKDCPTILE